MKNDHVTTQFDLVQDTRGMMWDLLLYVPTVIALGTIGISYWSADDQSMGYLFFFLTSFFFIAGFNRVFKTRLMLLPSAPVRFLVGEDDLVLVQKNSVQVDLVKNIKFYPDFGGKSFGVSGLNGTGKQLQFVFHRGQFASAEKFESAQTLIKNRLNKQSQQ
ncbi:MAG: hypothetical protein WC216_00880 [Gallionella sp.]|jgi:ABC-type transport system involved in multi-copper enzyme maturation permease subunit